MMKRWAGAALAAGLLTACETAAPTLGGGREVNFAGQSAMARSLSPADRRPLSSAFVEAVERGERGSAVSWKGSQASGTVTPGGYLVGNLWPQPAKVMPVSYRIDLGHPLETELGLFAAAKTANVRAAPSTEAPVLTTLSPGAAVDVVGKTPDGPWMLIATGGSIRGYVHESLLLKAPGAELELAGGPTRKPWRCREFQQELRAAGKSDRWTGAACDRGNGWRLVESAPEPAF